MISHMSDLANSIRAICGQSVTQPWKSTTSSNQIQKPVFILFQSFMHLSVLRLINSSIFKVKPTRGLLHDKYQMLVFKMTPKEKKTLRHQFQCRLNDNDKHVPEIEMLGSSEQPKILMETEVRPQNILQLQC